MQRRDFMIENFLNYVSNYDTENKELIVLKLEHSLRVCENSKFLAEQLGLEKREVELASKIGLLHDIGRFEQIRKYGSLKPVSEFDHGKVGVKILFEDGLISDFETDENLYPLISFAIENHNRLKIESTSDEKKKKFAKLVRDVDKIDIMYQLGPLKKEIEEIDESYVSPSVIEAIKEHRPVKKYEVATNADIIATRFAYGFDINYAIALKPFRDHLKDYYDRVRNSNLFDDIYQEVLDYLEERIDREC